MTIPPTTTMLVRTSFPASRGNGMMYLTNDDHDNDDNDSNNDSHDFLCKPHPEYKYSIYLSD